MSERRVTFGARYAALATADERLTIERAEGRRDPFATVDALLAKVISTALGGERVARASRAPDERPDPIARSVELLVALDDDARACLRSHFDIAEQETRGSWHLPDETGVALGQANLAHWISVEPRLAVNLADSERAQASLRGAPVAVVLWSLEPLFETLYLPIKLRAWYWLGARTEEQVEKAWAVIDPLYGALAMQGLELDRFRRGSGWSTYATQDVLTARIELARRWASGASQAADRYRTYAIGLLVERYYAKAKSGRARRAQVLNKPLERVLTAFFGGDWLAFLAYLGEEPHPDEQVVSALPKPTLIVGTSDRAREVARAHEIPPAEIERMLAAYWQQDGETSPVERRARVLERHWKELDALHARQKSGMRSLWGLVEDHAFVHPRIASARGDEVVQTAQLCERLLSPELNSDVALLWGTRMLPRWPGRLVTEPVPHVALALALGPATRFWHGIGLTAWFVCEGPYSRTDIDGMADYYRRDLQDLDELGCSIDGGLFEDLREAERRRGRAESGSAIVVALTIGTHSSRRRERSGVDFNRLRDIITTHRRAWMAAHLAGYIRARWERELRDVAASYHRQAADKGKPPTPGQFATLAADAANQWFGGDITGVSRVLGLPASAQPTRSDRLVPVDPDGFATRLYARLRGRAYVLPPSWKDDPVEREASNNATTLAGMCVDYLQIQEASGEPPTLATFGRRRFAQRAGFLAADVDEAWRIYGDAVRTEQLNQR